MKMNKERKLTISQQKFVNGLKNALNQVELHQQGKIQLGDADELLKELKK